MDYKIRDILTGKGELYEGRTVHFFKIPVRWVKYSEGLCIVTVEGKFEVTKEGDDLFVGGKHENN
jgi:hypothetical protein